MPPPELPLLRSAVVGSFVAEIGVGVVHQDEPAHAVAADASTTALHRRIKAEFDPTGRLNPSIDLLAP